MQERDDSRRRRVWLENQLENYTSPRESENRQKLLAQIAELGEEEARIEKEIAGENAQREPKSRLLNACTAFLVERGVKVEF